MEELLEAHSRILESIVQRDRSFEISPSLTQDPHSCGFNATQQQDQRSNPSSVSNNTENSVAWQAHMLQAKPSAQAARAHAEEHQTLPTSPMTYSGSPGKASKLQSKLQSSQTEEFPPYDLLYSLVDLYFSNVNTWCPILERRSTLNLLFGSRILDEADRVLLHAIVTTTLRFSADPRLNNEKTRQEYYSRSKQRVLLYGIENSSVRALQAMVILALDLHGSSNIGSGLWVPILFELNYHAKLCIQKNDRMYCQVGHTAWANHRIYFTVTRSQLPIYQHSENKGIA